MLSVWLQIIYTTKVITSDLQTVAPMSIYQLRHGVSFYNALDSFCLHFQKGEKLANWCSKAYRKHVNKYVMQSQPLLMHLAFVFVCN